MIRIPDTTLWLGNARDLRDVSSILAEDIAVIVDLAVEEPLPKMPRVINYCRFALTDEGEDAEAVIAAAVRVASTFVAADVQTIVCCNVGMNRSPSIAAAVLAVVLKCEVVAAIEKIAGLKPIDVNPALWSRVVGVVGSLST